MEVESPRSNTTPPAAPRDADEVTVEAEPGDASPETVEETRGRLLAQIGEAADAAGADRRVIVTEWASAHGGQRFSDATDIGGLETLLDDLRVMPQRQAAAA